MLDFAEIKDLKGFKFLKDLFLRLISASQGQASSTRLIYLISGLTAVFCAAAMTLGGIAEYCLHDKADFIYWSAVTALWGVKLGVGAIEKSEQAKHAVDRDLGRRHSMTAAASASGD
jgi:hypothetical protein